MFNFDYVDPTEMSQPYVQLAEGLANFTISEIKSTDDYGLPLVTKTGLNKMIVTLKVQDCRGANGRIMEHIASNCAWKLKQVLDAVGKPELYSKSALLDTQKLIGATGQCVLKLDDKYTKIAEYVIKQEVEAILDEQIPF